MDLRQLRYFLAVVEEGGFRRASRVAYVAQPAMSRTLRQLEQELGVELFNRTPTGVELTDAGVDFVDHARLVLRRVDDARTAMLEHQALASRLRVGATPLSAGELTEPIIEAFSDGHHDVDVDVSPISFRDQTGDVVSGSLDVAIVRGPLQHSDLDVVPIAFEPRALLVGVEHQFADEDAVDVEDVLQATTVPLAAPSEWATFWQLDDMRGGANRRLDVVPATTLGRMRSAVADGHSLISVPDAMRRLTASSSTRCIALRGVEPSSIAVVRRRRDRRRSVLDFVDQARETAAHRIDLLPGGCAA